MPTNGGQSGVRVGSLVLVATPIGNLGDLSPRAEQALRDADAIACEDTRHTRKLLSARGIEGKRLLAVHEHNEHVAADGIVGLLVQGQTIALVTDAGTPGISDPGQRVVIAAVRAGFAVQCVPGPTALVVALVVSGLETDRFVFEGFLPVKGSERKSRLTEIAAQRRTVVLYEAPHRLIHLIEDLVHVCGADRLVSISRELTKKFEETWRGCLGDAADHFVEPRGEFVLVLAGAAPKLEEATDDKLLSALADAWANGMTNRDAVQHVTDQFVHYDGVTRKRVYDLATSPKASDFLSGNRQKIMRS